MAKAAAPPPAPHGRGRGRPPWLYPVRKPGHRVRVPGTLEGGARHAPQVCAAQKLRVFPAFNTSCSCISFVSVRPFSSGLLSNAGELNLPSLPTAEPLGVDPMVSLPSCAWHRRRQRIAQSGATPLTEGHLCTCTQLGNRPLPTGQGPGQMPLAKAQVDQPARRPRALPSLVQPALRCPKCRRAHFSLRFGIGCQTMCHTLCRTVSHTAGKTHRQGVKVAWAFADLRAPCMAPTINWIAHGHAGSTAGAAGAANATYNDMVRPLVHAGEQQTHEYIASAASTSAKVHSGGQSIESRSTHDKLQQCGQTRQLLPRHANGPGGRSP
jgi:hypothetical protein